MTMNTAANRPLKVALIVDAVIVSNYTYELAQWAKTCPDIALTHIIVQELPAPPAGSKVKRAARVLYRDGITTFATRISWALLARLEQLRLRQRTQTHFARRDVSDCVPGRIHVKPEISKSGFVYRYNAVDIAAIHAEEFDVLLRCGSGILRGDILTAARFGILSFHHGDNRVNRGGPPGFWEVLYQQPTTGFVIQQLTDELDGGHVFFRGNFPTQRYWLANQAHLYERSNFYMKQMLAKLAITRVLPAAEAPLPYCEPLLKAPTLAVQLRYLRQFVTAKVRHIWTYRLLRRHERWGVAYVCSNWKNLVMWRGKRIPNPPGRFLADPFLIARGGKDYCFVEDYNYSTKQGIISVYELSDEAKPLGTALREDFHLSFPYLFEYDDTLYMVPESSKNKDIRLYECVSFPLQWKLKRIIMKDLSAVDSMIFAHAGTWWMLSNINPLGGGEHCSELYAFHTDDPVHGEWLPHHANPVIIDPTCARNGGLVFDQGAIYRVAQRQGFVQYGAGTSIRRIETLTPDTFEERSIAAIEPNFFNGLHGTHHLHSNGRFTVFDFVEKSQLV